MFAREERTEVTSLRSPWLFPISYIPLFKMYTGGFKCKAFVKNRRNKSGVLKNFGYSFSNYRMTFPRRKSRYESLSLCRNSQFLFSINSHRLYNLLIYSEGDSPGIPSPVRIIYSTCSSFVVSSTSGAGFIDFPRSRLRAFSSPAGIIFRNMALYGPL